MPTNIIEAICEEIGADPTGTVDEITETLEAASPEVVMEALKAAIAFSSSPPTSAVEASRRAARLRTKKVTPTRRRRAAR